MEDGNELLIRTILAIYHIGISRNHLVKDSLSLRESAYRSCRNLKTRTEEMEGLQTCLDVILRFVRHSIWSAFEHIGKLRTRIQGLRIVTAVVCSTVVIAGKVILDHVFTARCYTHRLVKVTLECCKSKPFFLRVVNRQGIDKPSVSQGSEVIRVCSATWFKIITITEHSEPSHRIPFPFLDFRW